MKSNRLTTFLYVLSLAAIMASCSSPENNGPRTQPTPSDKTPSEESEIVEPTVAELPDLGCATCLIDSLLRLPGEPGFLDENKAEPALSWEERLEVNGIFVITPGGVYHGEEVNLEPGSHSMLAVVNNNGNYSVERCRVEVTLEKDEIVDGDTPTGKQLTPSVENVVFLFEGNNIEPGPTYGHSFGYQDSSLSQKYGFELNGQYRVGKIEKETDFHEDYGSSGQVFFYVTDGFQADFVVRNFLYNMESGPSLMWAGDADRDGKPDFLVDCTDHYNVTNLVLFLSSEADAGRMVKPVAQFRTTGC